jgi:hypothetical protein
MWAVADLFDASPLSHTQNTCTHRGLGFTNKQCISVSCRHCNNTISVYCRIVWNLPLFASACAGPLLGTACTTWGITAVHECCSSWWLSTGQNVWEMTL